MTETLNNLPDLKKLDDKDKAHSLLSFKTLDTNGGKFRLSFPTPTGKFQTNIGGCFTILIALLGVWFFYVIMKQCYDTESPIVTDSTLLQEDTALVNMYDQKLVTLIAVAHNSRFLASDLPKFVTIRLEMIRKIFDSNLGKFVESLQSGFGYKLCSEIADNMFQQVIDQLAEVQGFKNSLFCPDFGSSGQQNYKISTNWATNEYLSPRLHVYPCSLADSTQCQPLTSLKEAEISYVMVRKVLNPSDHQNPVKLAPRVFELRLDPSVVKHEKFAVKQNVIIDDFSQFRPSREKEDYAAFEEDGSELLGRDEAQVYCSAAQVSAGSVGTCQDFVFLDFKLRQDIFEIRRFYKETTTILGEFGGIIKIMTTVCVWLYSFYNSGVIGSYFENRLFYRKYRYRKLDKMIKQSIKNPTPAKDIESDPKNSQTSVNGEIDKNSEISQKSQKSEPEIHVEPVTIEEVVKKAVGKRRSVVELIQKLNFVKMLEYMFMDDSRTELTPLVLMKAKEKELNKRKRENLERRKAKLLVSKNSKLAKRNSRASLFAKKRNQVVQMEAEPGLGSSRSVQIGAKQAQKPRPPITKYTDAYEELERFMPQEELKHSIKEFMMDNLRPVFASEDKTFNFTISAKELLKGGTIGNGGQPRVRRGSLGVNWNREKEYRAVGSPNAENLKLNKIDLELVDFEKGGDTQPNTGSIAVDKKPQNASGFSGYIDGRISVNKSTFDSSKNSEKTISAKKHNMG